MPAQLTLNTFLHSASLLLHAYPSSRITTKYSLPKPSKSKPDTNTATNDTIAQATQKKEPSATLTIKVYHPPSGICLKYSTDKAQEVGRLITSLGRLARGEEIELPAAVAAAGSGAAVDANGDAEKMDVDSGAQVAVKEGDAVVTAPPVGGAQQSGGGGSGGGKKKGKKGKR